MYQILKLSLNDISVTEGPRYDRRSFSTLTSVAINTYKSVFPAENFKVNTLLPMFTKTGKLAQFNLKLCLKTEKEEATELVVQPYS